MTEEKKKEYTRRISQSNSTQLIIVLYDIALTYIEDALKIFDTDRNQREVELQRAKNCIEEMIQNLHFEYELSREFHQIYLWMKKSIRDSHLQNKKEQLISVRDNLRSLKQAYEQIVSQDESAPIMGHTQSVIAGLTYGKTDVNESLAGDSGKRGFLV